MLIWHIEAMTQENDELRRQNKVLLDRLHQCKRRNREDKVKLRNSIEPKIRIIALQDEYIELLEASQRD